MAAVPSVCGLHCLAKAVAHAFHYDFTGRCVCVCKCVCVCACVCVRVRVRVRVS